MAERSECRLCLVTRHFFGIFLSLFFPSSAYLTYSLIVVPSNRTIFKGETEAGKGKLYCVMGCAPYVPFGWCRFCIIVMPYTLLRFLFIWT